MSQVHTRSDNIHRWHSLATNRRNLWADLNWSHVCPPVSTVIVNNFTWWWCDDDDQDCDDGDCVRGNDYDGDGGHDDDRQPRGMECTFTSLQTSPMSSNNKSGDPRHHHHHHQHHHNHHNWYNPYHNQDYHHRSLSGARPSCTSDWNAPW